ncbi:MAG TPA: transglutaminase family protein, partial [Mucilaginibacter sp.]|nr:transglutaminase family protein [Mucilaginibacter sp.]
HVVSKYPETFEVSYEEELDSYITMPNWYIQERLEQSVQFSRVKVIADAGAGFKYECKNIKLIPKTNNESGMDTYEWQISNVPAIKKEEQVMSWRLLPAIKFSTTSFNCFGYPGSMNSWKEFGDWIKGLNSDVCTLSDARVAEIKKMTDTIKTDKAKAAFLYKYMQQSMRYVGIQLGIGGFKPFPASFVDEKKYGDCKALSNYMRALLKAVNIPSHYALVRAGENEEPADFSFPHNDFNHIILCIPFKNDTTWLECTSNKTSFGKLGSFTENRNALLITDDGGKLVNTPKSSPDANRFNSEVHIILQPDGGAKTHVKILSTGEYRFSYLSSAAAKLDDQKEFWLKDLGIKQPSIFDFELGKDNDDTKQIDLSLEYDKFCDVMTGDKQFYRPLAFPLWHNTVPVEEKRNSDFYFEFPLQKSCITTIDLPVGYEVETMPSNASLKFTYGNYDISYVYNKEKNQVVSTAKFVLNNQVIPASKYTEMQEYFDAIAKAQNKKLVIHKKA